MSQAKYVIETDRLLLREFIPSDAAAAFRFNSNSEVIRYTGEPPVESVEKMRQFIEQYPDFKKYGYGRWALIYKENMEVIGFNGLKYLDWREESDLGYRMLPEYWGKGIATESSLAVIQYGFETLKLDKIVAFVMPDNIASQRVCEKSGLAYVGDDYYDDDEKAAGKLLRKYEIERS